MKNNKITTIIIILVVILTGGYIYKDFSSGIESNTNTGELSSIPNLDREIIFSVETSGEQKVKITNKINEIINRLKKNPNSLDDWISLGANRKLIGDIDGAIEAWKYANAIAPINIVPFNNLGNLYHYQKRDYIKAEEYFRKAIDVGSIYYSSPYLNLFDLYTLSYKQETDSAEKILLEGLEINPNDINILMILATYYRDNGNNERAVIYYNKTAEQAQKLGETSLYDTVQVEITNLK